MKRIIVFLIVVALSVGMLPSNFYANASEKADYSDSLKLLEALDIIAEGDSAVFGTDYLTRSSFAQKLFGLYNLEINSLAFPNKAFYDVSEEDAYYPAIMFLFQREIMRGYEDGSFKPEYFVTGTEAIVSFVNLLGYSYKAQASGGYPTGYIATAKSIGLLKGLELDYSYKLRGDEFAKITDNALTIPLMTVNSVSSDKKYEVSDNQTILKDYFNMERETGLVTANEYISISGSKAPEECIVLNGKYLKYQKSDCISLVGKKITAVYDNYEDSSVKRLVFYTVSDKDTAVSFDVMDFLNLSSSEFLFDGAEKTIRVRTGVDLKVFYNNSELSLTGNLMTFIKNIKDGKLTFVSTRENANYDILFITEYSYIVADRINQNKFIVSDMADKSSFVELKSDKKKYYLSDAKGNETEFSQIETGNVLEIIEGTDCQFVTVTKNIVSGILESVSTEYDYDVYSVSGYEYRINSERAEKYNKFAIGSNVKLYLNSKNEIIHMENTGAEGYITAYLIKAGTKKIATEDYLVAKFYDINGNFLTYSFKNGFSINDVKTNENMTLSEFNTVLAGHNSNLSQLVLIKLNEDEEVISMYLARSKDELFEKNEDGLCLQHPSKILTYLSGPKCFSHKIHVDSLSTPIFVVPKNVESYDESDFKIVDNTFMYNGLGAYVESYSFSKHSLTDEIVVMLSEESLSQELDEYVYTSVITSKSTVVNNEGVQVTRFKVTDGVKEGYFDVERESKIKTSSVFNGETKEYTPFDLSKGDVIRYVSDSENNLQSFEFYYDADKEAFYEKNKKELIGNGILMREVKAVDSSWVAFLHGDFSLTSTDYIKFSLTNKAFNNRVVIVEKNTNNQFLVSGGTPRDIMIDDKVVFQVAGNVLYSIVIIR